MHFQVATTQNLRIFADYDQTYVGCNCVMDISLASIGTEKSGSSISKLCQNTSAWAILSLHWLSCIYTILHRQSKCQKIYIQYPFFPAWQVLGRSSFLDLWWGQKSHAPKLTEKTPGGYQVEVTLRNCARAARSLKPKFTSLIKLENQKDKPTQEKCTVYINLLGHGGNEHITMRTHWVAQECQTSNELSL